jgi:hypothetical protein
VFINYPYFLIVATQLQSMFAKHFLLFCTCKQEFAPDLHVFARTTQTTTDTVTGSATSSATTATADGSQTALLSIKGCIDAAVQL